LINLLRSRGGEIGFGLIREDSDRSLIRLRIERPPLEPERPAETGNPFRLIGSREHYERALADYESKHRAWETNTNRRVAAFRSVVKPLLDPASLAQASDVWGAVRRSHIFLSESAAAWGGNVSRWSVLVTDGQANAGASPVLLEAGAPLLVVNGTGSVGALEHLKPQMFESVDAALREVIAVEENR
jgi:hypothetical protein